VANRLQNALLAQLVEHFHGKEGVAGSSPAEGFGDFQRFVPPPFFARILVKHL
jgi:hypothetical protein